jgi:hypothetical protein
MIRYHYSTYHDNDDNDDEDVRVLCFINMVKSLRLPFNNLWRFVSCGLFARQLVTFISELSC